MKLKVLGSGSRGNCYILENDTEALIIEAGVSFKEVKKALDFNVRKIVGVLISHTHGDHRKYWYEYVMAGIPVFEPYKDGCMSIETSSETFSVKTFELIHDVPCYGFYITHPEIGSLIYASDTEYIKYRFKGINHIMVECNYDKQYIRDDAVNRDHVLEGHMELQTTKDFLKVNNNPNLQTVVLVHLSTVNGDSVAFHNESSEIVKCPVWIAEKGLEINLGGSNYEQSYFNGTSDQRSRR